MVSLKLSCKALQSEKSLIVNLEHDFFPPARSFPEETMEFLYLQLEAENEASRIAALSLLRFFVHCDRK